VGEDILIKITSILALGLLSDTAYIMENDEKCTWEGRMDL